MPFSLLTCKYFLLRMITGIIEIQYIILFIMEIGPFWHYSLDMLVIDNLVSVTVSGCVGFMTELYRLADSGIV